MWGGKEGKKDITKEKGALVKKKTCMYKKLKKKNIQKKNRKKERRERGLVFLT